MKSHLRGMIVVLAILMIFALASVLMASPQSQGFMEMVGSGGLSGLNDSSGMGMP